MQALSSYYAKQALEAQYWAQETRHRAFVTFELVSVVRITDKEISKIETAPSLVRFAVFLNRRFALNPPRSEPASTCTRLDLNPARPAPALRCTRLDPRSPCPALTRLHSRTAQTRAGRSLLARFNMNKIASLETSARLVVTYRPVGDLIPDPRNARTHPKRQIDQIRKSIEAFGFTNPILDAPRW